MDGFTVAPFGAAIPERAIVYTLWGEHAVLALLAVLAVIVVLSGVAHSRHHFDRLRRRRRRPQLRSAHV